VAIYAQKIRQALTAAFDVNALAGAWLALHPDGTGDTSGPVLRAFLGRAREAITAALRAVLPDAWTEGWALGQVSAETLSAGVDDVDWAGWTPGDPEAAAAIAGPGLRLLLDQAGIVIRSIAETRLEELSAVLEQTLASNEVERPMNEPQPQVLSVGDLATRLRGVLDNPSRAELVAQAEIGRAQAEAARVVYAESGVAEVEISTAHDAKVCPVCQAAARVGPHPVGVPPMVLLHNRCRCAELPVLVSVPA
jgi:hypothetical protein